MPYRWGLIPHKPRAKGVKQYLERATQFEIRIMHFLRSPDLRKENLSKDVVEKYQLQPCGEVGIDPILSKGLVMLEVVPLQRGQNKLRDIWPKLTLKAEQ